MQKNYDESEGHLLDLHLKLDILGFAVLTEWVQIDSWFRALPRSSVFRQLDWLQIIYRGYDVQEETAFSHACLLHENHCEENGI